MKLLLGDCLDVLKTLPDNSIDACVTDPPYGLSFMGKKWDYDVPKKEIWEQVLRVLKPGGYLLSFAGTRTQHRMAVNIEDAGFEIRDMIAWIYGSGFPKSLNIGKAVDKLQGNEREVVGKSNINIYKGDGNNNFTCAENATNKEMGYEKSDITKGTSEWEGWGTALKPALEPITVARKPIEGTVAENCLKWGVGGINIDGCRVNSPEGKTKGGCVKKTSIWGSGKDGINIDDNPTGRFPANLIHDGSDEVMYCFPETNSVGHYSGKVPENGGLYKLGLKQVADRGYTNDISTSAARFFYCAKASKSERNRGCEGMEEKNTPNNLCSGSVQQTGEGTRLDGKPLSKSSNFHPTVKPIALMEYLIKLVSKEGHTILDPFMGSGSTGIACKNLQRDFIGIERDPEYMKIAEARIKTEQERLI